MQTQGFKQKFVSMLLSLAMILGGFSSILAVNTQEASALSGTITSVSDKLYYGKNGTKLYTMDIAVNGLGYCANYNLPNAPKGTVGTVTDITHASGKNGTMAKLMYYYAYKQKAKYTKGKPLLVLHYALSYLEGGFSNMKSWGLWKGKDGINALIEAAKKQPAITDPNFKAYRYYKDKKYQPLIFWSWKPPEPDPGNLVVQKLVVDEEGNPNPPDSTVKGFHFIIQGPSGTRDGWTGDDGTYTFSGLKYGTYTVSEVLTAQQEADGYSAIKPTAVNVPSGQTVQMKATNIKTTPPPPALTIRKTTDDGGPVEGFKFKVEGLSFNSVALDKAKLVEKAAPVVEFDAEKYTLGDWSVDQDKLDAMNEDAKNGTEGEYEFTLTNKLTGKEAEQPEPTQPAQIEFVEFDQAVEDASETMTIAEGTVIKYEGTLYEAKSEVKFTDADNLKELLTNEEYFKVVEQPEPTEQPEPAEKPEDKDVQFTVKVTLKNVKATASDPTEKTAGDVKYNDFDWLGAATFVQDVEKTTPANGTIVIEDIPEGHYKVTEVLTDEQKLRYHEPESQEKDIRFKEGETNEFTFFFENKSIKVPVELYKTSEDQDIDGIEFTLTSVGKDAAGQDVKIVKTTDGEGHINFGKLYVGKYRITETGFVDRWMSGYELDDNGYPFFEFEVDGKSEETLYIGDGTVSTEKEGTNFKNLLPPPEILTTLEDPNFPKAIEEAGVIPVGQTYASKDMTLIDTVNYTGCVIGTKYTVEGILMDAESETPVLDDNGNMITATGSFTPETSTSGSVEIEFKFDGVSLAGKTVVAYEKLFKEGETEPSATHENPKDPAQTVIVPKLGTSLDNAKIKKVKESGQARAEAKMELIDTVEFSNLIPDNTYLIKGILMDQETGNPAVDDAGNQITAFTEITPKESNGFANVKFLFDGASLANKAVVAFEELYIINDESDEDENGNVVDEGKTSEKLLAEHKVITDPKQTVYIPEITTTADEVSSTEVDDEIDYTNLIPGVKYVMEGYLVNQKTGAIIKDSRQFKRFTPDAADGTLEMTFKSKYIAGKTIVVFEKLYLDYSQSSEIVLGPEVAEHADIHATSQTVKVPKKKTPPKTGDDYTLYLFGGAFVIAAGLYVVYRRRKSVNR